MTKYKVEGTMKIAGNAQKFTKEIEAVSEARARDIILMRIGADHKLKRTQIEIKKVEAAQ